MQKLSLSNVLWNSNLGHGYTGLFAPFRWIVGESAGIAPNLQMPRFQSMPDLVAGRFVAPPAGGYRQSYGAGLTFDGGQYLVTESDDFTSVFHATTYTWAIAFYLNNVSQQRTLLCKYWAGSGANAYSWRLYVAPGTPTGTLTYDVHGVVATIPGIAANVWHLAVIQKEQGGGTVGRLSVRPKGSAWSHASLASNPNTVFSNNPAFIGVEQDPAGGPLRNYLIGQLQVACCWNNRMLDADVSNGAVEAHFGAPEVSGTRSQPMRRVGARRIAGGGA